LSTEATTKTGVALRVSDLHAAYGPIRALHGISLEVGQGSVLTLLGGNGSGKSTLLRVVSGMLPPTAGTVEFMGQDVTGQGTGSLVRRGIVQVPEGRQIFPDFTVEENLRIGAYTQPMGTYVRTSMEEVFALFPILKERRTQQGLTLSGGEQQMLAIGRALMSNPKLLLLDEPSLGLAPLIVQDIYRAVRTLNKERGVTILLVEQNAVLALGVATFAYVLEAGKVAVSGTADELRGNEEVRRSYLGY
jgi:branched-chain amino acid transport system ATP-binding protein